MFILSSASSIWHEVLPDLAQTLQFVTRYNAVLILVAIGILEAEDVEDGGCCIVVYGGEDSLAVVGFVEVVQQSLPYEGVSKFDQVIETS